MNIVCDKQLLTEAVANVSRAVSSKNTLAALEGVLLKAKGNQLSLTGYDLELAISTTIEAKVVEEGDIISINIPENTIELKVDEKVLSERLKNFVPKKKELSGYLKRYAKAVSGGASGAILN